MQRTAAAAVAGPALVIALFLVLWIPEARALWYIWHSDPSLSFGPLIPIIAAAHLVLERRKILPLDRADGWGFVAAALGGVLYVLGVWADIDFVKPLALVGMLAGAAWYFGGKRALAAAGGPLAMLVFMIPWPTTIVDRISFPLQLASSGYAAMLAGMLGIPVHRDGVNISVVNPAGGAPIYSIIVAQACSGLTSLIVLTTLGYLAAYHTPVATRWKLLLVAAVVPAALITNAIRLTIILLIGAHGHPHIAAWIHDHEGPVLILFCSSALFGLRSWILGRASRAPDDDETGKDGHAPPALDTL